MSEVNMPLELSTATTASTVRALQVTVANKAAAADLECVSRVPANSVRRRRQRERERETLNGFKVVDGAAATVVQRFR